MKRKLERIRLAKKKGWQDGNIGQSRERWPFDQLQLCLAYDDAYYEGIDAPKHSKNPYGVYLENRCQDIGWYAKTKGKAHFFLKGSKQSRCGSSFDGFNKVKPNDKIICLLCLKLGVAK